jgi:hypothetical protein
MMKIQVRSIVVCLMVSGALAGIAQTTSKAGTTTPGKSMQMDMCNKMMSDKKAMKEHMKAMDTTMENLVSRMESASTDRKVEAIAATVKEMVAQRIMTNKANAAMEEKMMGHMMSHMKSGKMECPMMKGMKGM